MNGRWKILVVVATAAVLASATAVQAWPLEGDGDMRPRRQQERQRERIGLMMMWRLTEALELDQDTAARLFPMMREFDVEKRQLHEKRRDMIRQMKAEVEKDNPDRAVLRKMIDDFKQNEIDIVNLRNKRLDDLSKILSDEQVAKMIIFVPQFERNVRELISDVRARRKQRGGMRMQGEPGGMQSRPMGPRMMGPGDMPPEPEAPAEFE